MKFLTLVSLIVPFTVALVEDGMIPQEAENLVEEIIPDRDLVRSDLDYLLF
jgi:hypothetical protein